MLLPALSSARERARTASCVSNCKQIGVSLNFYVADNNDYLVPRYCTCGNGSCTWANPKYALPGVLLSSSLHHYFSVVYFDYDFTGTGILRCPSDSVAPGNESYGIQFYLTNPAANAFYLKTVGQLMMPANMPIFAEIERIQSLSYALHFQESTGDPMRFRHGGGKLINITNCDGSVITATKDELKANYYFQNSDTDSSKFR